MRGGFQGGRDGLGCNAGEAVQALVQGAYEPGAALGAARGALQRNGQAAVGFLEDDVGEGAGGVVFGQQVRGTADIDGDGAGGAGEQQGNLLEVRRGKAGAPGPSEHGLDEALVELPVEGELDVEASFGVVEHDVGVGHRAPSASSSWSWSPVSAAGPWMARKRA